MTLLGEGRRDDAHKSLAVNSSVNVLVPEVEEEIIRQGAAFDGVYIRGSLYGQEINVTVDTGASKTIIALEVYNKIAEEQKPTLRNLPKRKRICTADGKELKVAGCASFVLNLGHIEIKKEFLVADIEDEVLLGADVLQGDNSGPADLLLSKGIMVFRGTRIPLIQEYGEPKFIKKVCVADHYIIPGMSEMIIDAYVQNLDDESSAQDLYLIEPVPLLAEIYGLVLAPSVVDLGNNTTARMRVLNPFSKPVSIKQDAIVGYAQLVSTDSCTPIETGESGEMTREAIRSATIQQKSTKKPHVPDHLVELYLETIEGKTSEESRAIASLLVEFGEVFSKDSDDLGLTHLAEHVIDTGGSRPLKQPPRRVPTAFAGEDIKALEKLQRQGVIRPSNSPWASPIVLVHKKDGSVRFCTDYRRLNQVTKKDAFPIPRTEDCFDALTGAVMFSTMDITSAYHQIPVHEADIPKTAFTTKYGLFEYVTMPFGLCNATATFQRVIELALSGLQWTECLVYLDDVIVFSKNFSQHLKRLRAVLTRIQQAGLKLKPSKCKFMKQQVGFLGHVLSEQGILPNPENIRKIIEWEPPKDVRQVRSFLGLGNYYRRFVKDYSKIVKPLTDLTKKGKVFQWSKDCHEAFLQIKEVLTGADLMAFPMTEGEFILDTDACDVSIGCVLSQVQDGTEKVIAYSSRTLNRAERNYCVTDRELLAVKYFMEYHKHYLLGRKFVVRSDHQALKWLFSLKEPKNRTARWLETMSAFDFIIEYRPGPKHGNADAMSRCPNLKQCACEIEERLKCGPCKKCLTKSLETEVSDSPARCRQTRARVQLERSSRCWVKVMIVWFFLWFLSFVGVRGAETSNELVVPQERDLFSASVNRLVLAHDIRRVKYDSKWLMPYSLEQLRRKQLEDSDIGPVMRWKESGVRPFGLEVSGCSPATRLYWHYWDSLEAHDGLLYKTYVRRDGTGKHLQLLVPKKLRNEVLYQMHNTILSGHLGQKKTREKTLQRFFWYGIREDVNLWVLRCDICSSVKTPSRTPRAPMGVMRTGAPWDRLAVDMLGPFPESTKGNKYVMVVTDHFSKWVEVLAVPDQTAITCARVLLNEVVARFGCPFELLSDQGRNFDGKIFSELCAMLEIRKKRTSPANPRCNGQTERFNKTLVRMIKSFLKGQQREWDTQLGCLAAAYRATVNESTGMTPNLLMLGREVRLPVELMFGSCDTSEEISSYGEIVSALRDKMQLAHEVARKNLVAANKRQKEYYDARATFHKFNVGDLVWYASELSQLHLAPKLRNPYNGPFLIVRKLNDLNYRIQFNKKGTTRVVHYNKLKPYNGDKKLKWSKSALKKEL